MQIIYLLVTSLVKMRLRNIAIKIDKVQETKEKKIKIKEY